jgi:hypothetical protein
VTASAAHWLKELPALGELPLAEAAARRDRGLRGQAQRWIAWAACAAVGSSADEPQ